MLTQAFHITLLVLILSLTCSAQSSDAARYNLKGRLFYGSTIKGDQPLVLLNNNVVVSETNSDSLGHFSFSDLKSGEYKILIFEYNVDTSFSIGNESIDHLWIFLDAACEVNKEVALKDIEAGKPRLLLVGGIAPVYVLGQENFEKKFNVQYHEFGCTPPSDECVKEYNQTIFRYLDSKYGKKWRKEVRPDVEHLKNK